MRELKQQFHMKHSTDHNPSVEAEHTNLRKKQLHITHSM